MEKHNSINNSIKGIVTTFFQTWTGDMVLFTFILCSRFLWIILFPGVFNPTGRDIRYFRYIQILTYCLVFVFVVFKAILPIFTRTYKKPMASSICLMVFFLFVCISRFLNRGAVFPSKEVLLLSIGELFMITMLFYFIAPRNTSQQFDRLITANGLLVFCCIFMLNIGSLYLFFAGKNTSLNVFGTLIERKNLFVGANAHSRLEEGRYFGLFSYPTVAGFRNVLSCILGLHLANNKKVPWIFTIANIIMAFVMIILADSRAAMINMIIVCVFAVSHFLYCKMHLSAKKIFLYIFCLVFGILIALLVIKWQTLMEFLTRFSKDPVGVLNVFGSDRINLFVSCVEMAKQKPIFGHGWYSQITYIDNSHNLFGNLLAWTGFGGTMIFALFLIIALLEMYQTKLVSIGSWYLVCLLICTMIQSLLDKAILGEMHNPETYMFWLCLGYFAKGTIKTRQLADTNKIQNQVV